MISGIRSAPRSLERLALGIAALATVRLVGRGRFEKLVGKLVEVHARALSPKDALRFLLHLDARIYQLEGEFSVAYGNGLHTKHRHTGYHDFFVARVGPEDRVLDIGCGLGAVAYDMAEKAGARVVGIDISASGIALARQRNAHDRIEYMVGDALSLRQGRSFDVVVLSNILEHLPDRVRFLRRVLETSGAARVLIRVPLFERDWRVPLKRELGVEWRLDPTHETEYTLESFAREMDEAGLTITHQEVRWGEIWAEVAPV